MILQIIVGFQVDWFDVYNSSLEPRSAAGTIVGNFLGWLLSSIGLLILSVTFYQVESKYHCVIMSIVNVDH